MRCQWRAFINLVPPRLRDTVDLAGRERLLELRLRIGQQLELIMMQDEIWLNEIITKEDILFTVNAASQYSPWAATSIKQGYISAPGGHRLGICGSAIMANDRCSGITTISSVCIRVARDIPDISRELSSLPGSILLVGPPGSGKSTLLRDLIRTYSNSNMGNIAVVDERGELFPYFQQEPCFLTGKRTDVLSGCTKNEGITMLLRSMGPTVIAVDEITAEDDCRAIILAGWCGVRIFATAHARDISVLRSRSVYKPLLEKGLFDHFVVLQNDKSWKLDRNRL